MPKRDDCGDGHLANQNELLFAHNYSTHHYVCGQCRFRIPDNDADATRKMRAHVCDPERVEKAKKPIAELTPEEFDSIDTQSRRRIDEVVDQANRPAEKSTPWFGPSRGFGSMDEQFAASRGEPVERIEVELVGGPGDGHTHSIRCPPRTLLMLAEKPKPGQNPESVRAPAYKARVDGTLKYDYLGVYSIEEFNALMAEEPEPDDADWWKQT